MKTHILRHRRENLKKCSLRGLETRNDLIFYTYPVHPLPDLSGYIVLKLGAPLLSAGDRGKGLLLIDGTWRLASIMAKQIPYKLEERSLPPQFKTAYPREPNPEQGLASVEALYIAHRILGLHLDGLLDGYHWKDAFLKMNNF